MPSDDQFVICRHSFCTNYNTKHDFGHLGILGHPLVPALINLPSQPSTVSFYRKSSSWIHLTVFTMASKMVIQQPKPLVVAATSDQWSTSICECESVNECCFSVWCFPCFACITARDHGECLCLPLLDSFGIIPPVTLSMRVSMRKRYGITDTICNDCVYAFFCGPCSWCQIRREMKARLHPLGAHSLGLEATVHPTTMATQASCVVFQQPQPSTLAIINSNQWSTGICDCFDDCNVCCFAGLCFPVFACHTMSNFGEFCCLPTLEFPCLIAQSFGSVCYTPPISLSLRASVRNRYGIQGDMASDCLYATFCNVCSWCQIAREIKRRRTTFTLVHTQPTVIAPPPMMVAPQAAVMASQSTMISQTTMAC
ncbi:hypothetical protein AOLI_G00107700 [Acnodon oligacanthus]